MKVVADLFIVIICTFVSSPYLTEALSDCLATLAASGRSGTVYGPFHGLYAPLLDVFDCNEVLMNSVTYTQLCDGRQSI